MGKLTRTHVYLAGAALALVVGGGMFFLIISPAQARLKQKTEELNSVTNQVQSLSGAEGQFQAAQQRKQQFERDYRRLLAPRIPPAVRLDITRGTDPYQVKLGLMGQWWALPARVIPMCERFARSNPYGVRVRTEFGERPRSTDPRLIPDEIIAWNLGRVTARGTFRNLMAWVRRWNRFQLLVALDNLNLRKVDANEIEATANLIVYIFPVNAKTKPALVPEGRA